jgi:hypothetical protein
MHTSSYESYTSIAGADPEASAWTGAREVVDKSRPKGSHGVRRIQVDASVAYRHEEAQGVCACAAASLNMAALA